jgi:hypothetical protein
MYVQQLQYAPHLKPYLATGRNANSCASLSGAALPSAAVGSANSSSTSLTPFLRSSLSDTAAGTWLQQQQQLR